MLKISDPVNDARQSIEALASKMGLILLVLGGMHFFNLLLFSKIRASALNSRKPMPVGEWPLPAPGPQPPYTGQPQPGVQPPYAGQPQSGYQPYQ